MFLIASQELDCETFVGWLLLSRGVPSSTLSAGAASVHTDLYLCPWPSSLAKDFGVTTPHDDALMSNAESGS